MPITKKIAISVDEKIIKRVDRLVERKIFPNRSKAFQIAVEEKINRFDKIRLATESAKLNKVEEQDLSDEGLSEDYKEWPEY